MEGIPVQVPRHEHPCQIFETARISTLEEIEKDLFEQQDDNELTNTAEVFNKITDKEVKETLDKIEPAKPRATDQALLQDLLKAEVNKMHLSRLIAGFPPVLTTSGTDKSNEVMFQERKNLFDSVFQLLSKGMDISTQNKIKNNKDSGIRTESDNEKQKAIETENNFYVEENLPKTDSSLPGKEDQKDDIIAVNNYDNFKTDSNVSVTESDGDKAEVKFRFTAEIINNIEGKEHLSLTEADKKVKFQFTAEITPNVKKVDSAGPRNKRRKRKIDIKKSTLNERTPKRKKLPMQDPYDVKDPCWNDKVDGQHPTFDEILRMNKEEFFQLIYERLAKLNDIAGEV